MPNSYLHSIQCLRLLASSFSIKAEPQALDPSWQRLPPEHTGAFIGNILDDMASTPILHRRSTIQSTLLALAYVCRNWNIISSKPLFEDIYVTSHAALDLLSEFVEDSGNKQVASLIRSLVLGTDIFKRPHNGTQTDYTKRIRSYQRICDVCPNLTFVYQWRGRDYVGDIIEASSLDISRLTHLEVSLGGNLVCVDSDNNASFLGSVKELPAVQELVIRAYADGSMGCDKQWRSAFGTVVLPAMPCLRRLSISNWDARHGVMAFRNYYGCKQVRDLEYINCSTDNFYNLLLFSTIERLVITGPVNGPAYSELPRSAFFDACESLTHICIPFSIFRSCDMPRNLQYLLLDGTIDEDEINAVEDELVWFFGMKVKVSTMQPSRLVKVHIMDCLQHVHILSPEIVSKDKSTFRHGWHRAAEAARKVNVSLTLGIDTLQWLSKQSKVLSRWQYY